MSRPLVLVTRTLGKGDQTVVVLHGLLGSGRNWLGVGAALADSRRVLLVDLRNHGDSPWADNMTYPDMADDVRATLARHGIDNFTVVGHSMGGKVAMRMALEGTPGLEGIAAIDIAPVTYLHDHSGTLAAMQALDLGRLRNRGDADAQLRSAIADAAFRQFVLQNLARDGEGYRWRPNLAALRASMDDLVAFSPTEARYDGPALAIVGGLSSYVTSEGETALAERFPRMVIERLGDAGHWPHAERPEAVIASLRTFLDRVRAERT